MDIVFKNYTSLSAPGNGFFRKVLETAAQELKLKDKIEASINLIGENKIRELNKKYRDKNEPTDVLSFPMAENIHDPSFKFQVSGSMIHDIGDIFICLSIAKNEAKRENITIKEKLAQLATHGFLHLLGYDHEKSKQSAKNMFELENKILSKL